MEPKIICMFKIRSSVGADTTFLSNRHGHPSPQPQVHCVITTSPHPGIYMPWKFSNNRMTTAVTNKEVITNFLQLLSSEGSPEMLLESQPYKVVTKLLWTSPVWAICHSEGSPLRDSWPLLSPWFLLWQIQCQPLLWRHNKDVTFTANVTTVTG